MIEIKQRAERLTSLLDLEQESQLKRWSGDNTSIKELRSSGELMYPVEVKKHSYSFDNFPSLEIHYANYFNERLFFAGSSVIVFNDEDQQCKAYIQTIQDRKFEIQLFTEDIPEWVKEGKIGVKPQVDEKSFKYMKGILNSVIQEKTNQLQGQLTYIYEHPEKKKGPSKDISLINDQLNESQVSAVKHSLSTDKVISIQGPPGTGKTTTLVEIIGQLKNDKKKVIASAPSNTAVDNLALKLIESGLTIVRLGNTAKVNQAVWSCTPEGILSTPKYHKQLKKLRVEVNELRRKAEQYKRNFTKEDRENRKRWRDEARKISKEIRSLTNYQLSKHIEEADVILGTPVGLCDSLIKEIAFDVAILDEAGQCLIPMGFLVMDNAERIILCGDQAQLPPTVIDNQAQKEGLDLSILEEALQENTPDNLLSIQYRMPPQIAGFSSSYFYEEKVKSYKSNSEEHLLFFDTAGAGFKEQTSEDGSKWNDEELNIVQNLIENYEIKSATFISPYSAQVRKAKAMFSENIRCSTIDGFQGQEDDIILISLVRSNDNGEIGFLKDYRRMNVALTRARNKLIVIGDSSTLGGDEFYQSFFEYVEKQEAYKSIFEILYE